MKLAQDIPQDDDGYSIPVLLMRHAQKGRKQAGARRNQG